MRRPCRSSAPLTPGTRYWQDPLNEAEYLSKSVFLADINNARPEKNATYRANMITLNAFVMVLFLNDSMVQPRQSEVRC